MLRSSQMEQSFTQPIRRYFELEAPRGRKREKLPLLIALHGYQGDKDSMMRVASQIANGKMIVIALQGPNQFVLNPEDGPKKFRVGFGWGARYKMQDSIDLHHRDIRLLIRLAAQKYRADLEKVFLLGFSQACSYNYRFVFTHPREVRGVIAVCGGVPSDWSDNPNYQPVRTHVLHIAATRDRWYTRKKNLEFRRKLAERAASLEFRSYRSTHRFPRASIPHIRKWIEKHL